MTSTLGHRKCNGIVFGHCVRVSGKMVVVLPPLNFGIGNESQRQCNQMCIQLFVEVVQPRIQIVSSYIYNPNTSTLIDSIKVTILTTQLTVFPSYSWSFYFPFITWFIRKLASSTHCCFSRSIANFVIVDPRSDAWLSAWINNKVK